MPPYSRYGGGNPEMDGPSGGRNPLSPSETFAKLRHSRESRNPRVDKAMARSEIPSPSRVDRRSWR